MSNTTSKSPISGIELAVLTSLYAQPPKVLRETDPVIAAEVGEIATKSGVRDREEVLRALYTLEGKSLVQPHPAGDFTSHHWRITDNGMRALHILSTAQ